MTDWEKQTTIYASKARGAIESGKAHFPPAMQKVARELVEAPLTPMGLVDISKLSKEAVSLARSFGIALSAKNEFFPEPQPSHGAPLPASEAQGELFRHFSQLFAALVGVAPEYISDFDEIRARLIARYRDEYAVLQKTFNPAADELTDFYRRNGHAMFAYAKSLGGMKAVSGGQRQFTEAGLEATRISSLYLDTQLIPDPVYPFLASDLPLNAKHLQLAHVLFYVLQLRPLVDARLEVPPVVVFPSFEEPLEENDPVTKAGIEALLLQVVTPVCDASIASVPELLDYAVKHSDQYLAAVMGADLFVPVHHLPGEFTDARAALRAHVAGLEGRQSSVIIDTFKRVPAGVAVTLAMLDRLRPQYHMLENSQELQAQPLMALPVHWHYFKLCASASARELVNNKVLSEANLLTLRALQDESVAWLANIPIEGLVEMRRNMEVATFREELKKYTAQLASAGPLELDEVVKEVNHGLSSLVARHAKAMEDVRTKYWPKVAGVAVGAALGAVAGAGVSFFPALAAAAAITAPIGAAVGAMGTGGLNVLKEITGAEVERRQLARHSLMGMLAAAKAAG
jgi:hypothetical protein